MKKHLILFFAGVILSYGNIKAQTVPDKKEILKVTLHVNDYFMKKYANYRTPSFVKKVVRPSNIWTRSVYYEGLMALYSIYPADEYYLYAKEWADYHQWGFHRGTTTRMQIITAPAKSISIYTTFAPILKKYGKRKPIWICWSILHK